MTVLRNRPSRFTYLTDWIDIAALSTWGIVFLKYWLTGKLGLLIRPNYFILTIVSGLFLLLLAGLKAWKQLQKPQELRVQHMTLLPPGTMAMVFLVAAVVGLVVTPHPFTSQTAIQRGLEQNISVATRTRPQAFRVSESSESRSLVDWVRTLNTYPEPDAYAGQKANVKGFVVYSPSLPDNYLTLTRFVITCCAADAYPIGLPVKLQQSRKAYLADQWLAITGQMHTESLNGKRQLVLESTSITSIPEPKNPYDY